MTKINTIGPNVLTEQLVGEAAKWLQEKLTHPDTRDFVKLREMRDFVAKRLDEILEGYEDVLTIVQSERMRDAILDRIQRRRFRRRVFHKLLADPSMPVAVTLVNSRCVEERELWEDDEAAYAMRRQWLPSPGDPGFAIAHGSAVGICAADRQAKSIAGSTVTAFKRMVSWVMRNLHEEDALLSAARVAAAGQVLDARFKHDARYSDERDRLVMEYQEKMAVGEG
jgi:hypothetical protein